MSTGSSGAKDNSAKEKGGLEKWEVKARRHSKGQEKEGGGGGAEAAGVFRTGAPEAVAVFRTGGSPSATRLPLTANLRFLNYLQFPKCHESFHDIFISVR